MMAMKIVVLVMTVAALGHGIAARNSCMKRKLTNEFAKITREAECGPPQQIIVPMPIPESYDYVNPKVVKVKRCSDLPCSTFPEKCLPRNSIPREITVEAHDKDHKKDCVTVTVYDHDDCECGCKELQCREDMVFNEDTCRCECDPQQKLACDTRRFDNKEDVMWSDGGNRCACVCDHELDCGDPNTSVFDRTVCRCININI